MVVGTFVLAPEETKEPLVFGFCELVADLMAAQIKEGRHRSHSCSLDRDKTQPIRAQW